MAVRSSWSVDGRKISSLSDDELSTLMARLIRAEAAKCGISSADIVVNTQIKAADDGADCMVSSADRPKRLAGRNVRLLAVQGRDERTAEEARGRVEWSLSDSDPRSRRHLLSCRQWFDLGQKGEDSRKKTLQAQAPAHADQIVVYGSERLANWITEHPAITMALNDLPRAATFEDWSGSSQHASDWVDRQTLTASQVAASASSLSGRVTHVHLHGAPGVGKTRLALEVAQEAGWADALVYFADA